MRRVAKRALYQGLQEGKDQCGRRPHSRGHCRKPQPNDPNSVLRLSSVADSDACASGRINGPRPPKALEWSTCSCCLPWSRLARSRCFADSRDKRSMADRRYPYIWTNSKRPPWRAARWADLLTAGAILLFLFFGNVALEVDPM